MYLNRKITDEHLTESPSYLIFISTIKHLVLIKSMIESSQDANLRIFCIKKVQMIVQYLLIAKNAQLREA